MCSTFAPGRSTNKRTDALCSLSALPVPITEESGDAQDPGACRNQPRRKTVGERHGSIPSARSSAKARYEAGRVGASQGKVGCGHRQRASDWRIGYHLLRSLCGGKRVDRDAMDLVE